MDKSVMSPFFTHGVYSYV